MTCISETGSQGVRKGGRELDRELDQELDRELDRELGSYKQYVQNGGQYRTARNGRSVIPRSQITALEPMGIMLSIIFEENRDSSGLPLKNDSTTLVKRNHNIHDSG